MVICLYIFVDKKQDKDSKQIVVIGLSKSTLAIQELELLLGNNNDDCKNKKYIA